MGTGNYNWATDKSRFGLKLMQKMGWTEGKGLGREEDGRLKHVSVRKHGKQVGVGADTIEAGWEGPAAVAAGLNDVLARLASVGGNQAGLALGGGGGGSSSGVEGNGEEGVDGNKDVLQVGTDATDVKREKSGKNKKSQRGFYERRRARKNVGAYSKQQLNEIFGGVDSAASFPKAVAAATTGSNEVTDWKSVAVDSDSESDGKMREDDMSGPEAEGKAQSNVVVVSKTEPKAEAVPSVDADVETQRRRKPKKSGGAKNPLADATVLKKTIRKKDKIAKAKKQKRKQKS